MIIPVDNTVEQIAAIEKSTALNEWLLTLKGSDPGRFDEVRRLSVEEQEVLAGL